MLIPALLHRFGRAVIEDEAKGCTLGVREIDPHIEVLRAFGAEVADGPDGLVIAAPKALRPMSHWLDYASVTTTENFLIVRGGGGGALAAGQRRLRAARPGVQSFPGQDGRADRWRRRLQPDRRMAAPELPGRATHLRRRPP